MSEEQAAYNVKPISPEQREEIQDFLDQPMMKFDTREGLYNDVAQSKRIIYLLLSSEQAWRKEALRQYPTPDAYEAVCKALDKHCKRADKAQEQLNQAMRVLTSIQQNPHMVPSALCRLIEPTLSQGTEGNHESNNNNSALGNTDSDR